MQDNIILVVTSSLRSPLASNIIQEEATHKKNKKNMDEILCSQDIFDHFSIFGSVVHVALSFDVSKFWEVLQLRNTLNKKIEAIHQLKQVRLAGGGDGGAKSKDVKRLEVSER